MKYRIVVLLAIYLLVNSVQASELHNDDPLLGMFMVDRLEVLDEEEGNPVSWDVTAWIGRDLEKVWFKTKGLYEDSEVHSAEYQLLYGWAITPYWDLQAGWRLDSKPKPDRNWLALGIQGTAPYFVKTEATLFAGEENMSAFRLNLEYEFMLTQKWVLSPEFEINAYGNNDQERGIGSGLSDMEFSLRLLYEVKREFAPYVGLGWEKVLGNSADYARAAGQDASETTLSLGIRAWF